MADIPPVPSPGSDQAPTSLQIPGFYDAIRAISALPIRVEFSLNPDQFSRIQEILMSLRTDQNALLQSIKDAISAEMEQQKADLAKAVDAAVAPLNAKIAELQDALDAGDDKLVQADIDALKSILDGVKNIVPDQPVPIVPPPIIVDGGDDNPPVPPVPPVDETPAS